jgi:CelD/BcsL family acetyltransferase involved in cellulose biosynthesis
MPYLNHAGVLSSDSEARRALAEEAGRLAATLGADRLEVRGRDGSDLPLDAWGGKSQYVLDLPASAGELWERLGAKLRSQVKRPGKEGFTAKVVTAPSLAEGRRAFYPLLARRWHELGSPILPERFFSAMEGAFPDDFEYLVVEREGAPAAAGVLLRRDDEIEIPWAASSAEHDRLGVNMLLYWRALERAVERGAGHFDFGRSTPGSGNARFKTQWGAVEAPLRWNVVVRGTGRGRATERGAGGRGFVAAAWRLLPGFVAGRLGPVLAARIPY